MPQMSPLLWLNLLFMFILGFFLFSVFNFFIKPPLKILCDSPKLIKPEKSWKW
uniref:ATP synthase F0 subunit 8 n=1 Tax=Euastacus yarraensis TaxID=72426 RepID=W9AQA2_9EUCA|nr:ATP synthase F0 subunit 8 [Euastacus yarraensis]CDN85573.1 ATP synthase F0 subunit 8 [Euastacus yarraensis]